MLPEQLSAAGLAVFPCRADKAPAIPKGTSWQTCPPSLYQWPSPLIGIPIPAGVAVIDVDRYKGITPADIDRALGVALPWSQALIQTTMQGGEHYAFRVSWPVRNSSNLLGVKGFDTRSAGKGYICTGEPHYTGHGFGVFRLSDPASLPDLPDQTRALLEHVETTPVTHTAAAPDMADVVEALKHIDPGRDRAAWVKVGMALRTVTDDPTVFDQWSSGQLTGGEAPPNYVAEHVPAQWASFKPHGDTTIASLFYEALQGGWRPSSRMDTAAAFGTDGDLVGRILAHGGDPRHTDDLITAAAGNALLLALLTRELKEAGLLTRPVKQRLDLLAGDTSQTRARGEYGKNHTENATLYLERHHADGGLRRSDETWYQYTGKAWEERTNDDILYGVACDMASSLPMHSNIQGTYNMMARLCHYPGVHINEIPDHLIIYGNGVLDLRNGQLLPHHPGYFATNILPYDYMPQAPATNWLAFLQSTLEGDQERIALLQEWFGYMISNSCRYHKILFMLGPPRSGKGLIGKLLEQIVGVHNFSGCALHAFASDSFLEALRTKSVAFSGDTARSVGRMNVDIIITRLKEISGNDSVTFDRKYKGTISQALPTRITLAGNNVPNLFDDSGALASRMLVLTFEVSYLNHEDHTLFDTLMTELPGISAWALEGLKRLSAADRFTVPAASAVEADFIAESYSPLRQFVKDMVHFERDISLKVSCVDLYNAYRNWATGQNDHILSRRVFTSAFKDTIRGRGCRYGVYSINAASERGFSGISLAEAPAHPAFQPTLVAKT